MVTTLIVQKRIGIMTYDRYFGDVYMSDKWDKRFLELAKHISDWSKDPSTKVGCIVVGEDREIRSTGFNGFPRGIEDKIERLEDREQKYPMICHAEENAIMHAARIGISLKGTMAYVTWPPCSRCTRSLIQAGGGAESFLSSNDDDIGNCGDGLDNDNGGAADRDDPDCYANPTSFDGYDPNRTEANRDNDL